MTFFQQEFSGKPSKVDDAEEWLFPEIFHQDTQRLLLIHKLSIIYHSTNAFLIFQAVKLN